jgi:hypothetical protein
MRTSLRWWSSDEFEDGVAHGWQSRLGRWPVDSFFLLAVERRPAIGGRVHAVCAAIPGRRREAKSVRKAGQRRVFCAPGTARMLCTMLLAEALEL